jgi:hypothetical protein
MHENREISCTPSRILEIRGLLYFWELPVPPWHCSDLVVGQSMPAFLDGSASAFQIDKVSSPHTPLEGIPSLKRVPMRPDLVDTGIPIWCPQRVQMGLSAGGISFTIRAKNEGSNNNERV